MFVVRLIACNLATTDIRSELGGHAARHQYKERVTRRHFVTRQDHRNITRVVQNYSRHCYSEDAISVDRIATELSQENPCPAGVITTLMTGDCKHIGNMYRILFGFSLFIFVLFSSIWSQRMQQCVPRCNTPTL